MTFRLVGEQSAPIVGEEVRFSTSSTVGGIKLADGSDTDTTSNEGLVTTVLQSGTISTSVEVLAEHVATGITASSGDITISTGVPVANRFSVAPDIFNPDAADHLGTQVVFSVIASDYFGNDVPDGTRVTFTSTEAGNIDDSCELIEGKCTGVIWESAQPVPENGLLTILAHTTGAEAFDDLNGNNVFDSGDDFNVRGDQDLAEAYLDENENDDYDVGEFFVDANENGIRDPADGEWNGPCMSGIDPSALCPPGVPDSITISQKIKLAMSSHSPLIEFGSFGAENTIHILELDQSNTLGGMIIGDRYGNSLPGGTIITFEVDAGSGSVGLSGFTEFEIPTDIIVRSGPYSVNIVPTAAGTGTLKMTIALEGHLPATYTWILDFPEPDPVP